MLREHDVLSELDDHTNRVMPQPRFSLRLDREDLPGLAEGWLHFEVTFRGDVHGPLRRALADLDPRWEPSAGVTVVDVVDQSALVGLLNRANALGLSIVGVRERQD